MGRFPKRLHEIKFYLKVHVLALTLCRAVSSKRGCGFSLTAPHEKTLGKGTRGFLG